MTHGHQMNNWDRRWFSLADFIAQWSKDRSRKTAAVIVDDRNILVALGWNGFPRHVDDDKAERHERPAKYQWTEHAERNAIYNAAANGYQLRGTIMYLPWVPCADCCRAIIQAGIATLKCHEPDWNDTRWAADFAVSREMLKESGVNVQFMAESP